DQTNLTTLLSERDTFVVEACIGLAVPGRPIGPWSRRTGAPQASATGRDRTPWSVLGPQPMGEPRTTVDKSGHRTLIETAGRHAYGPLTSGGADRRRGVRVSPPPASPRTLAHEAAGGRGWTLATTWQNRGREASSRGEQACGSSALAGRAPGQASISPWWHSSKGSSGSPPARKGPPSPPSDCRRAAASRCLVHATRTTRTSPPVPSSASWSTISAPPS